MALGIRSTQNSHKQAPTVPQRYNRLIDVLQTESDFLLESPPRSTARPISAAPARLTTTTRVSLRPISVNPMSVGPTVAKRPQNRNSINETHDNHFSSSISNSLTDRKSLCERARRDHSNVRKSPIRFQNHGNVPLTPTRFVKRSENFTVVYTSEPMDIEVTLGDLGSKCYGNDSMEVDGDDDSMEVDDMESLMDFAAMH